MRKYITPLIEITKLNYEDIVLTSFSFDEVDDLDRNPSVDEIM